jgi:hypothetical protein
MHPADRWKMAAALGAVLIVAGACQFTGGASREKSPAVKDFSKRVAGYVELQKSAESKLPKLGDESEPEKIAAHKKALAASLVAERSNAQQGGIFTPAIAAEFRSIIKQELAGAEGRPAREVIRDGNPMIEGDPAKLKLAVNARYPDDQPVSTMPPDLLLRLPKLPSESLEYRFIGKHLILRDNKADLIVDYIRDAAP